MTRATGFLARRFYGLVSRLCPPGDRRWVDAVFAELSSIDGHRTRAIWLLGLSSIVFFALRARTAGLSIQLRLSFLLALVAWVIFGAMALSGSEGLGLDDDLYIGSAMAAAAALVATAAGAMRRIFNATASSE
jgi:hypothetical protein